MKIHILQHLPHENAGSISDWANKKHYMLSTTHVYQHPFEFPPVDDFDMLVILGGTMGVYEEEKFPWLHAEKNFIQEAIKAGKIILGICLGSQLLAEALGSKVYAHDKKEIGFFPIYKTEAAMQEESLAGIPKSWTVFHWHGDTFDLPPAAVHLFSSDACKNQGFRKDKCVGFQFHAEINDALLGAMVAYERDELIKAGYVQSETEILGYGSIEDTRNYFYDFLERITQQTPTVEK